MHENELLQRVERLERGICRWKLAALALLLGCLVLFLAGFDYAQPNLVKARSVEAQSFVLRDADGQVRARMAIGEDGPYLSFFDEHGKVTSSLPLKPEIRPAR
jgi:cell division septal protein FtsQ